MIVVIDGPAKSGKSTTGNALRNNAIAARKGALLIDEDQAGDPIHLLEKIIAGDPFKPGTKAEDVKWKPDSQIILIGPAGSKRLEELEAICPGFTKKFGPTKKIKTGG